MSNSSIWSIDWTLSDATTPCQSESRSNGNERVLCILQCYSITVASPSVCLVSYPGHSVRRGSSPSAEMKSACSSVTAKWAEFLFYMEYEYFLNKFIWPKDGTPTVTTTPVPGGPGSNGNYWYFILHRYPEQGPHNHEQFSIIHRTLGVFFLGGLCRGYSQHIVSPADRVVVGKREREGGERWIEIVCVYVSKKSLCVRVLCE